MDRKPMETAPKDGSTILLGDDMGALMLGEWRTDVDPDGFWAGAMFDPNGIMEGTDEEGEPASRYEMVIWERNEPTWWAPIPAPLDPNHCDVVFR